MKRAATAGIALAALLAAGCTAGQSPATAPPGSPAPASTAPAPAPSPTARLTKHQAARAYVRIVDPGNRLGDALDSDERDSLPFSQYRADTRADVAELRREVRQLTALRWPKRVQPYVAALASTDFPADIACYKALAAAGSYTASDTAFATRQDCQAAARSTNADTIRSMLGLPSRLG